MSEINQTIVNDKSIDPKAENVQHSSSLKESLIDRFSLDHYSIMNKSSILQIIFYEILGMFIFTYGITCFDSNIQLKLQSFVCLVVSIVICAPLCGANFNPAITLSNYLRKQNKYKLSLVGFYLIAQLAGCFLGLFVSELINGKTLGPLVLENDDAGTMIRLIMSQFIGTFILIFFTLQISNPNTTFIENQLSGYSFIAIFIFMGRQYAFSHISTINFSLTFCINVVQATKSNFQGFKYIELWLLGDLLGLFAATLFYDRVYEPTIKYLRESRRLSQEEEFSSMYQSLQREEEVNQ